MAQYLKETVLCFHYALHPRPSEVTDGIHSPYTVGE